MTSRPSLQLEVTAGNLRWSASGAGAVFVEYIVILVLVAIVSIPTLIGMGVVLSGYYTAQQTVLTLPFP